MSVIIIFIFIMMFIISSKFRCIIFHPFLTIKYICIDIYKYIKYKRYREYRKYGTLSIFTGLFGKGKTLMLTKTVRNIYKKYNNKLVYDFNDNQWKPQYIHIVSNVQINDIPYIPLNSLTELMEYAQDKFNDGVSTWLFVVDEMSTQVNSREYKNNFTTELLNILLTCRHYRFQIIGSAQRFNHVDALVRQVTSTANECDKLWRLCTVSYYNAWTIENTSDVTKIKPTLTRTFFITNEDYNAYDTRAVVENFKDNVKNGNILSDKEILEYQSLAEERYNEINLKRRFRKKLHK